MSIRFYVVVFVGAKTNGVAVVVDGDALRSQMPVGEFVEVLVENLRVAVGVDFRYDCGVAVGKHRAIHHCSADYVNVVAVVFFYLVKQLVERFDKHITFRFGIGLLAVWVENDIYAVLEGHTARERQEGIATHYDDLTARIFDEVAHIGF